MDTDPMGTRTSSLPRLAKPAIAWIVAVGVVLMLGSGADPARAQLGIPGFSLLGGIGNGLMGSAVAAGDFNGDGFDDLALGLANFNDIGLLQILYGGPGNWSLLEFISVTQLGGTTESGLQFGAALAVGDFDDDGYDDLAIGAPGRTVNGESAAGEVLVVYGSPRNLDLESTQFLSQAPLPGVPEAGDRFGSSLATGDLSDDGVDDLAIGIHREDLQGAVALQVDAGAVNVVYGIRGVGLTTNGSQLIHEDRPGVGLNANTDERFGFSLAIGQFTGNAIPDLAVGVPGEIVFGPGAKGAVVLFPGAAGGLDPVTGVESFLSQESPGILGTAQEGDDFGHALAAGNFDGDLWTDLAIGVPGESELGTTESGAVQVLYGGAIGLTEFGDQFIVESSFDTDVQPFDRLGTALAAGDFDGDGRDDLAIGAPLDNSLGFQNAGEVDVLYGSSSGLTLVGGQVFNMIFFDTLETEDLFGAALAVGRFFHTSSNRVDLAVGIPKRGDPDGADPGAAVVIRSQTLFTDGFESGDLSGWTSSFP